MVHSYVCAINCLLQCPALVPHNHLAQLTFLVRIVFEAHSHPPTATHMLLVTLSGAVTTTSSLLEPHLRVAVNLARQKGKVNSCDIVLRTVVVLDFLAKVLLCSFHRQAFFRSLNRLPSQWVAAHRDVVNRTHDSRTIWPLQLTWLSIAAVSSLPSSWPIAMPAGTCAPCTTSFKRH